MRKPTTNDQKKQPKPIQVLSTTMLEAVVGGIEDTRMGKNIRK